MLHVIAARYESDYRLRVAFSDGLEGIADLASCLWGPIFEDLRDPVRFAAFKLNPEFGVIEWDNGADLAPEALEELARISGTLRPA